ncbi:TetR/AcrR family transcriptional regulator [Frankia sp. CNm7]|uniref:TetR/AcrR family transcriptional regulator n=1 Tax=Frankia nepalensis TaxID=1836974 RepID=A0A937RTL5_9ACTN|nr:TetR/AcrR family transcriptional regulator [Frankia nepalensis]MBL7500229.1 TetR/AcrR family transcriptional regulator [Frankia nepalensis]MBL7514277.1 TetR/AcrR family transcriptional regulator [Frankia nepalensis]MBL7523758.1 TetR/AcrR family transcriptional regulator [Frankia nepalensis]MBL7631691.1 TetR/AcrR family transcriptional regulator [Frankia nepalensis]
MADHEPPSRRRPRGRPRDPNIEPVVLATTRQLLGESGFAATTVQEISRRCGVNVPAIYRRWPTRLALIEEAAFSALTQVTVEPTGDLRGDLRHLIHMFESGLGAPAARAAIPGLMAAYQHEAPPPAQWLQFSLRPHFYAIVKAAGVEPSFDLDEVFDAVHGILLGRIFVPLAAARHHPIDNIIEMIIRILTPPANTTSPGLAAR